MGSVHVTFTRCGREVSKVTATLTAVAESSVAPEPLSALELNCFLICANLVIK